MDSDLNIYEQNKIKKKRGLSYYRYSRDSVQRFWHLSYSPLPVNKVMGDLFEDIMTATNAPNQQ